MHIMRFIAKENNSFVGLNVAIAFSYEEEFDLSYDAFTIVYYADFKRFFYFRNAGVHEACYRLGK